MINLVACYHIRIFSTNVNVRASETCRPSASWCNYTVGYIIITEALKLTLLTTS